MTGVFIKILGSRKDIEEKARWLDSLVFFCYISKLKLS